MRTFLIGLAQLFIVTVGLLPPIAARAQGTWQWAQATNCLPGFTAITGTVMNRQGDTYLTGYAADALTLGAVTLPAGAFLICLDSLGAPRWAQRLDGPAPEPRALALDTAGGVYLAGAYRGALQFGNTLLTGSELNVRIFVAHCSPEGQWRWAVQAGSARDSSQNRSEATTLALAPTGDIWVGGNYGTYGTDTLRFSSDSLINDRQNGCGFLALLSADGRWQRAWGLRDSNSGSCRVQQISVDDGANAYVTGSFAGTLTLGATQLTAPIVSGFSGAGFVAKLYGPAGWRWARQWGINGTSEGLAVAVDPGSQDPIVAGVSVGQVALDGHPVGGAWTSGLLGRLDRATGQWRWATPTKVAGASPGPGLSAMQVSAQGRLYAAGKELPIQAQPGLSFEGVPTVSDGRTFVVAADVATGAWQQVWRSAGTLAADVVGLTTSGAQRVSLVGRYTFRRNDSLRFGSTQLLVEPCFGARLYVASLRDTRGPLGVASDGAALRLQLWPNPTTTTAQLTLPTAAPVALPVRVLDALGREVRRTVVAPGARTAVLPVAGLPPGCYWVRAGTSGARLLIE